jgi:hypothetical protein
MSKKALILIENNQICDVVDSEFPVTSDFQWVDCDDDVRAGGYTYDGTNFIANPEPTYRDNRATAYPSIQEQLDMQYWDSVNSTTTWKDAITQIKTDYPKT